MKKILKKIIRSADVVFPIFLLVLIIVGLPILQLYCEGAWITFLTLIMIVLIIGAYAIILSWIIKAGDWVMAWAKEEQ